jgi:ferredoxin
MLVWVDQDACVGNGVCEEICPEVFVLDGGLAFVRDGSRVLGRGIAGAGPVPEAFLGAAIDAAEECPAECIFFEEG